MKSPSRANESIILYLLGECRDNERDQIEERLLLDPEFLESVEATENDLLHAYLRGELKFPLLSSFESVYLRPGPRRNRLEHAQALRAAVLESRTAKDGRRSGRIQFAVAVAVAACVVLGALGLLQCRYSGVAVPRVPPIAVLQISPAIVRSNSGVYAVMKTPVGAGAVHLRFALPEKGLIALRAVLGTPERPGIWSGPVAFDSPPAAHVEVDAALLARGDYLLSVSTAAGYVASYVFRVD